MDNLAHTLVGAALGRTGLARLSGLSMATLMIGANIPDLDILAIPLGHNLEWRRGWTHGPIGILLLPPLLALSMLWFDRWQARRGRRPQGRLPVRLGPLLGLAWLATLTHPLLDFMNVYAVRLLMPFSGRWFHADTLFIIDPWIWTALALGAFLSRRRWQDGLVRAGAPAIASLVLVSAYILAMAAGSIAARRATAAGLSGPPPRAIVAHPVPVNPFARELLLDYGESFRFGSISLLQPARIGAPVPTNMRDPAVLRASAQPQVRGYLGWSLFPFAQVSATPQGTRVVIGDGRFGRTPEGRIHIETLLPDQPGK